MPWILHSWICGKWISILSIFRRSVSLFGWRTVYLDKIVNLSNWAVPAQQMDHWLQDAMLQREASAQIGKEITDGSGQVYQKPKDKILETLSERECISKEIIILLRINICQRERDRQTDNLAKYRILRQSLFCWKLHVLNCSKVFTVWIRNVRSS